jgi:hypothetical protein
MTEMVNLQPSMTYAASSPANTPCSTTEWRPPSSESVP